MVIHVEIDEKELPFGANENWKRFNTMFSQVFDIIVTGPALQFSDLESLKYTLKGFLYLID
jgi:hypothetical protein